MKSQVLLVRKDMFRLFRVFVFAGGVVLHIFYINFIGQQIIDSSMQIFYAV